MGLRLSAVWLVCWVAGCGPGHAESETAIVAPPIRYLYDTTSPRPCEGTVPFLSLTASHLAQYLNVPVPPRIDYHFRWREDLSAYCPASAPACTFEQDGVPTVWSQYPTMPHELVHATLLPLQPVRFFAEGLAVALGGYDANPDSPPYSVTPNELLDNDGASVSDTAFFAIAGDFSSYLLDRWGTPSYVELNPRVPVGTSTNDVETAFSSVYGESMSAAFSDRQNAGQRYAGARIGFPECSLDPTAWNGNIWTVSGTLDCTSNGVSVNGTFGSFDAILSSVDVPSDGTYQISLHSDVTTPGQAFLLQRCVSGEQFQYWPSMSPIATHVVIAGQSPIIVGWLSAGRYFSQFSASTADRPNFNVALQPTGTVNNTCSGLTPLSLDNSDGIYAVPAGGQPVIVPFATTQPRTATAILEQASLFVCDGVCDVSGAGCQTLTLGQTMALNPGHVYFVIGHSSGLHAFAGLAVPITN